MNVAVGKEVGLDLKLTIFNVIQELSHLLVSAFKAYADCELELKIDVEHSSYPAKIFLSSDKAATLFASLELNCVKKTTAKEYQNHHNLVHISDSKDRLTDDALLITEKSCGFIGRYPPANTNTQVL